MSENPTATVGNQSIRGSSIIQKVPPKVFTSPLPPPNVFIKSLFVSTDKALKKSLISRTNYYQFLLIHDEESYFKTSRSCSLLQAPATLNLPVSSDDTDVTPILQVLIKLHHGRRRVVILRSTVYA